MFVLLKLGCLRNVLYKNFVQFSFAVIQLCDVQREREREREMNRAILTGVAQGWRSDEERLRDLFSSKVRSLLCGVFGGLQLQRK